MKMTINLRKVLFFLLTLCLIGSAYAQDTALKEAEVAYTKEDYAKMINRKHAIVFAPTVTVKSSPDASGTDLFVLHEGTNVTVKSTLGEWSEIELEDGNVGWMPSKDIEKI